MPSPARNFGRQPFGSVFDEIKTYLVRTTGHTRLRDCDDLLMPKIARRIEQHHLPSIGSYLDLLKSGPEGRAEFDCLVADLTIGETSFFRHSEHFAALRDHILPDCLARHDHDRCLRIWSAGCANGAEAYSIAIVLDAVLGERLGDWDVQIVGSDINRAFLAEAEKGLYSAWSLRDVPDVQRATCFVRQGETWAIRDRYRQHVRFVPHNLAVDKLSSPSPHVDAFDIIMCRNVMIYFDEAGNSRLADALKTILVEDGTLFVAPTDFNPRLAQHFTLEKQAGALVYRNRPPRAKTQSQPAARLVTAKAGGRPGTPRLISLPPKRVVRVKPAKQRAGAPEQPNLPRIIALADRAEWAAAARDCEALLAADGCDAAVHYYYALVQHYSGSAPAAEQALRRALYLDSEFALAHYQLGLLRKAAGDLGQCCRAFANVLGVLSRRPDEEPVSPCGRITACDLRYLAMRQLDLLDAIELAS